MDVPAASEALCVLNVCTYQVAGTLGGVRGCCYGPQMNLRYKLRGQGPGLVNVLLAASPATRSRPRAIKGQEPGLVDVLLQPTEQTRSHRKAEVVNELLWVAGPKERSPALAPGP